MKISDPKTKHLRASSRLLRIVIMGSAVTALIALFLPGAVLSSKRHPDSPIANGQTPPGAGARPASIRRPHSTIVASPSASAEEIVASKLSQFARDRRLIVEGMAMHFKAAVPAEVQDFFAAVEAGNWDEVDARFKSLAKRHDAEPRSPDLDLIWQPILEADGAAEQAHLWPAQKLLDYGHAILDSLSPGMVYVGGTDPGCFIPTMLNDTSDGERHITLTQNALADDTYLNYLNFLYGDRLATLTQDDRERAFQDYVADFQKRQAHDEQFQNEPKQLRPGEEVRNMDGTLKPYGQVAVMGVNEFLFQTLLKQNPDASFALEESFPFKSTYADATTLGPIMQLRVQDQQDVLSPERATQSVEYWRQTAQQLLSEPDASVDSAISKTYSKLATAQANLFLSRNYAAQAEEALRLATEICPFNPEAIFSYVNLLTMQGRFQDAMPVVKNAVQADPENQQFRSLLGVLTSKMMNN